MSNRWCSLVALFVVLLSRPAAAAPEPIEGPFALQRGPRVIDVKPASKGRRLEGAGLLLLGGGVIAGSVAAILGIHGWVESSRGEGFDTLGKGLLGGFGQLFFGFAAAGGAVAASAGVYFLAAPEPPRALSYTDNHARVIVPVSLPF